MQAAGFEFTFRVGLQGKEVLEIESGAPELIRLERNFGISVGAFTDINAMKFEWLAFIAWSACRRRHPGEFPEFEEFIDQLEVFDILADDAVEVASDPEVLEGSPSS
jgi:hypothetical protein